MGLKIDDLDRQSKSRSSEI